MKIRDLDGDISSLESRIRTQLEDHSEPMWPISELLAMLAERAGLTEDDLLSCGLIETGETIVRDDDQEIYL